MSTSPHEHIWILAIAAVVAVVSACAPPPPPPPPPAPPDGFDQTYLTREGSDHFVFASKADTVTVTGAASNVGSNSRVWFWRLDAPVSVDQQSCATFSDSGWPAQEGVALRVRTDNDVSRGITVTKNVYGRATSLFNVHVWDTSKPERDGRFTHLSASDMSDVLADSSYPWTLCARAVGEQITFKVWPAAQPEPTWADITHVRTTTLPSGWAAPGVPGTYVGHLGAMTTATFSGISTTEL